MMLRRVFVLLLVLLSVVWNSLKAIWIQLRRSFGTNVPTQQSLLTLPADPTGGGLQPRFFESTFEMARAKASREHKFLLVYLHSSSHPDTIRFCREVLCTEMVASFLEENFVLWGGDVSLNSEADSLRRFFRVVKYPYIVVLTYINFSSEMNKYLRELKYYNPGGGGGTTQPLLLTGTSRSSPKILCFIEGFISKSDLMQVLTDTLEGHQPLLLAAKAVQEDRAQARRLLEQQDREYRASEELDKLRELQILEDQIRMQREEELKMKQQLEQEQAKKREESEREEKERREEEQRIEREKRLQEQSLAILQTLPSEPEPGGPNTTQLAIRFSDGTRVERRFLNSDPLKNVFAFVSTKEITDNKVLATHFPKQVFSDLTKTLQQAGLCPKATLFVEEKSLNKSL